MADDQRLIDGIRAGSRTDFATLVERYVREVYPFLARLSGLPAAERLTQETFVRAWDTASTFHSDRPLRSWLLGLAIKAAAVHDGFDGRWESSSSSALGLSARTGTRVEVADDLPEAARVAARSVAELPFPQRAVLILKTYGNASVPEISATIEAGGDTVSTLLQAAYTSYVNRLSMRGQR